MEHLKSAQELVQHVSVHSGSNWNLAVLVFLERRNPEYPEKNHSEQGDYQQQTQPAYDAGTENRTWATMVGGECSHPCTIPVPPLRHPRTTPVPPLRHRCSSEHLNLFCDLLLLRQKLNSAFQPGVSDFCF